MKAEKVINGIKFHASADDSLKNQLESFLNTFEQISTENIKDGFILEMGFSVYKLLQSHDGYIVTAPDFLNSPLINFTEDLTFALWITLEQIEFLNKYKIEGEPIRFDDIVTVSEYALNSNMISLQRFSDLANDSSGWVIEAIEEQNGKITVKETKKYSSVYAYQLLKTHSYLLKLLVLPYNFFAIFKNKEIAAIFDSEDNSII